MNGFKMNAKTKKLVALLLVASLALGSLFASPLNLASALNDAKIYNENYKAVNNPNSADQGWLVRTKDSQVSFENQSLKLTVGENSLIQFTSLDDNNPNLYLLDGWLCVTSSENVNLTITTTVTGYSVKAGSSVIVISDASTENGYVQQGSAKVLNAITGVSNTLEAGTYLDLSQPDAQPKAKEPEVEQAATIEQQVEPEPLAEATTEVTAEPVTETVAEEAVPEEVSTQPLTKTFSYAGYEATLTAYTGKAIVEYPTFVTDQEIYAAAQAAYNAYTAYLADVYIKVVEAGKAEITYPETYGQAEFDLAVSLLEKELPSYLESLFATSEPEVEAEAVAETAAEAEQEETVETTEAQETPLTKTFSYRGYEATITAYTEKAIVEYPTFVTDQEVYAAAEAACQAYGNYLDNVYLQIVEPGKAIITYPETYGEKEFNLAVSVLEVDLPFYIASVRGEEAPKIKVEAEVNVDTSEAVVIEIVAPETSAPKTEPEVATETTEEVTPEVIAEAKPAKKSSVKFGATLGAVYGQYEEGETFKAFIDKDYIRNVGFNPKSIIVNLDPYISVGNFTFGLHISLDILSVKDFFTFDTENGAAGYVSSIAKFLGRINYNSENVKINLDRNHSIEFSSPVFFSMDKAFDKNNSLVATASANFGFIKLSAFADDLQLTNYLNGKPQYAGLSLEAGSKHVAVTASAIAKVNSLENIDFYPAIDAYTDFKVLKSTIGLYAGFGSVFSNASEQKALLGKFKVTFDFSNVFDFGVGVAYNHNAHLNDLVNNSYLNVTTPFEGDSLDVLLSTGLHLGIFTFDSSMSLPLSLNEDRTGKLAYQTITTADGTTKEISADVMSLSAKLNFGIVSLTTGVLYNGFSAKVANIAKALRDENEVHANFKALVDPDLVTFYTTLNVNLGGFEAYLRGDLISIDNISKLSTSIGASFTF